MDRKHWLIVLQKTGAGNSIEILSEGKLVLSTDTYSNVYDCRIKTDGSSWSVAADTGGNSRARQMRIVDGSAYGPFDYAGNFGYTADGKSLTFDFRKDSVSWLRLNDKEVGPYDSANVVKLPDGSYFGAVAQTKTNMYDVFIGNKKYGPFTYVNNMIDYVSADGKDWLTRVYRNGASFLLQNGKETPYNRIFVS